MTDRTRPREVFPTGVVAGADAGAAARPALVWAARTAVSYRKPLVVCHSYGHERSYGHEGSYGHGDADLGVARAARDRAWRRAEEGAAVAAATVPEVEVYPWAAAGPVVEVLRSAVRSPTLYVVTARGSGVLLGLVECAAVAPTSGTPVVLVRRRGPDAVPSDGGQVVVGVDGTERGTALVGRAFEMAAGRGAGLVAVPVPPSRSAGVAQPRVDESSRVDGFSRANGASRADGSSKADGPGAPTQTVVEGVVASFAVAWPEVEVTIAEGDGTIAGPLRVVRPSDLLLVGSVGGGRGGVVERLGSTLGCVALNRARCPVALVPLPADVPLTTAAASGVEVAGGQR